MADNGYSPGARRRKTGGLAGLLLLEAALVVCWSSGFVGVRFASEHAPIFLILLWRCLVAGLLLLPLALRGGRPSMAQAITQAAVGALAMSGYLAGYSLGIAYGVPTGLVALIADLLPLAVALLSWPVLGQAVAGRQWLGFTIGLLGVLVASAGAMRLGDAPPWAYGLPVLGMLALAFGTLLEKRGARTAMPLPQGLCIQSLVAAAIFAPLAWQEGGLVPPSGWGFAAGILWLVALATFGGYGLYYLCLRRIPAAQVAGVLYLSPPLTMLWAWAMFGEPLSWAMALGLAVSLGGVVLAARPGGRHPGAATEPARCGAA